MAAKRKAEDVIVVSDSEETGLDASAGTAADAQRRAPSLCPPATTGANSEQPAASGGGAFRLIEIRGDLFSVDETVSLAHCVARDLRLGKVRI